MPFYDHKCLDCNKEFTAYYPISRDPKEIECEYCQSKNTERLIGKIHIGWERRIYNTFVKADDERGEAQENDHMGPNPYAGLSGEEPQM